jgi:hypothetical protein
VFANRSVIEVMVLVFTIVVGFSLLLIGATIALAELRDPTVDTTSAVQALLSILSGIVGALLGLLAGKSETRRELLTRPDQE